MFLTKVKKVSEIQNENSFPSPPRETEIEKPDEIGEIKREEENIARYWQMIHGLDRMRYYTREIKDEDKKKRYRHQLTMLIVLALDEFMDKSKEYQQQRKIIDEVILKEALDIQSTKRLIKLKDKALANDELNAGEYS
jgi:hypothetical protein